MDDRDRTELAEHLVAHGYTDLADGVARREEIDESQLKDALLEIDEQYAEHLYHKTLQQIAHV